MTSAFTEAGFEEHRVPIKPSQSDPTLKDHFIYALRYHSTSKSGSKKVPLLLLHGHPQNHLIYHRLAPALSENANRDIVITDLRGHGKSGVPQVRNLTSKDDKPSEEALRARYSKREMARDMIQVMQSFEYDRFAVVGHDRGGRVAHRMAMDFPEKITRVMVLDIVPTYDLYYPSDPKVAITFAISYWHWFFLIQPYPFPENLITKSPENYLNKMVTRFNTESNHLFPPDILESYRAQLASPDHVHATCEDYRCAAPGGIDLQLDEEDRKAGKKVKPKLRALWGRKGLNEELYGEKCLNLWKNVCEDATGRGCDDCGHYMPEEIPEVIEKEILDFFVE